MIWTRSNEIWSFFDLLQWDKLLVYEIRERSTPGRRFGRVRYSRYHNEEHYSWYTFRMLFDWEGKMVFFECCKNFYAGSVFVRQTKKTTQYCRLVAKLNSFGANRNEMRRYSIPNGVDPFLSTIQMIFMQKILLSFDDCGRTMVTCVPVHPLYRSICRWKSKNQWFLCNWTDFLKTQLLAIFLWVHRKVLW